MKKPVIAMDLQTLHTKGSGPYVSTINIINSNLTSKYEFKTFTYNNKIGSGISYKRINDIKKQLQEIKPDIVHFGGLQLSGFHIIIACILSGVKHRVVTIHGFSSDNLIMNKYKKFILTYFIDFVILLFSSKIVGVSRFVIKRKLVQLFRYKCFGVIYNFPPKNLKISNNCSIREELSLKKDDFLIVTVSRVTKEKGMDVLLNIIPQFETYDNIKFIIIGIGDYFEEMKLKLNNHISNNKIYLLGYRNDIQSILSECNIFVLPTLHETLSIALLEASMAGLPLIASDTGGIPEIIENDKNGFLFPIGNETHLKEKILYLYNNRHVCDKLGSEALIHVKTKFSHESIEENLDKLYRGVLKN